MSSCAVIVLNASYIYKHHMCRVVDWRWQSTVSTLRLLCVVLNTQAVCMYTQTCVQTHMHAHRDTHTHTHTHTHTCTYACMHAHWCEQTHMHVHTWMHCHTHTCKHTCMHAHIHTHTCIHLCPIFWSGNRAEVPEFLTVECFVWGKLAETIHFCFFQKNWQVHVLWQKVWVGASWASVQTLAVQQLL